MPDSVLGHSPDDAATEIQTPTVPYLRGSEARVTLGTLFEILEDKERRFLLYLLHETEEEWLELGEVIERLGGHREAGRTDRQLQLSLTHAHLPKLEAAGLVEYDEDAERLRYRGHSLLEQWLRQTREMDLD